MIDFILEWDEDDYKFAEECMSSILDAVLRCKEGIWRETT